MRLNELKIGEKARIDVVGGKGATRQHFLYMGVIPGAKLEIVKYAPMGDPVEIRIHGYELTLRLDDAKQIEITKVDTIEEEGSDQKEKAPKEDKIVLPKDRVLKFALVGNQNCGKTTLFNRLTGSNQHVGNFPGVTVDRKDGAIQTLSSQIFPEYIPCLHIQVRSLYPGISYFLISLMRSST